jgi:hypothetical protein
MSDRKPNPYTRKSLVQARVNNEELAEILKRALYYCDGDLAKYARLAMLNYKGPKKQSP